MPRWPHQTEGAFAAQGRARCLDRRAGRVSPIRVDLRIKWRIKIEIFSRTGYVFDMFAGMRPQQFTNSRLYRFMPFPISMPILYETSNAGYVRLPCSVVMCCVFK